MNQLTFISLADAELAKKQIWINKVKKRALEGANLVGDGSTHYTDLSGLEDNEISQLKIYSSRNGIIDSSLQGTTQYAIIRKAWQLTKWFFPEPDAEFMTGVTGHTVESYNADWEPEI